MPLSNAALVALGFSDTEISKYLAYVDKKKNAAVRARFGRTGSARKDSQMTKVYRAEWAFLAKYGESNIPKFETAAEVQKWINKILKSKTWEKVGARRTAIKLEAMKDMGSNRRVNGVAYGGKIRLSPSAFDKYTILHEMAHEAGHMHHDLGFRITLLKLVSRFLGREAAKMLKKEFRAAKLKLTVSTKIKSPEDWLASYRHMAAVREMRQSEC